MILADNYVSYAAALEMSNIERLDTRREKLQLAFARQSLKTEFNSKVFPLNQTQAKREKFKVNFARTKQYQTSAVIACQQALNKFYANKK